MIRYTPDANYVLKKWSTWLAILAASAYSGSIFWERLPSAVTGSLPDWIDGAMALIGLISTMLVPLATSIQQKSIPVVDPSASAYSGMYGSTYYQDYAPPSDEEMP